MTALRVLTYNIRGGLGMDGIRDTHRIAHVAATQKADIICFQEVHQRLPWSGWIDQPGQLGRALKMRFVFGKAFGYWGGGYGVGIATHLPVTRVMRHRLPGHGEPRIALEVNIDWDGTPLTVFCTHWGLTEEDRRAQSAALTQLVRTTPPPVIVCGDFNETSDMPSLQFLRKEGRLLDAGEAANSPTYSSEKPRARIDMVMHSPELICQRSVTIPTLVSDHVPVVVDLTSSSG